MIGSKLYLSGEMDEGYMSERKAKLNTRFVPV